MYTTQQCSVIGLGRQEIEVTLIGTTCRMVLQVCVAHVRADDRKLGEECLQHLKALAYRVAHGDRNAMQSLGVAQELIIRVAT